MIVKESPSLLKLHTTFHFVTGIEDVIDATSSFFIKLLYGIPFILCSGAGKAFAIAMGVLFTSLTFYATFV